MLEVRDYDAYPDVMIYNLDRPDGYPNGRRIADDIVGYNCALGDCALQEVAFIEGDSFTRQTINDKTFLDDFPYLAEPWPSTGHAPDHTHFSWWWVIIPLLVLIIIIVLWRKA